MWQIRIQDQAAGPRQSRHHESRLFFGERENLLIQMHVRVAELQVEVEQSNVDGSFNVTRKAPPEAILWFNPFVADADVLCPTGTGFNGFCSFVAEITGNAQLTQNFGAGGPRIIGKPIPVQDGVAPQGVVADVDRIGVPDAPVAPPRDMFWPRSAAAWIVLSAILILASVNLVSPTRRWRPNLRIVRRSRGNAT